MISADFIETMKEFYSLIDRNGTKQTTGTNKSVKSCAKVSITSESNPRPMTSLPKQNGRIN
jgi:hypothetical protein